MKGILFVDEDQNMLQGLRRQFYPLREEWETSVAASGEEALDMLSKGAFDVIVTEIRMPVMDGVELLATVRDRHPDLIRIVLTAQSERNLTLKSATAAHQYVVKPTDSETLRRTIARASALKNVIEQPSLKELVSGTRSLPSIPSLYVELIGQLESPDSSVEDVARVIARDTAMTAKVLQLANSAFFGIPRRITSPKEAVIYLGVETIKALALTVKVFQQYKGSAGLFSIDELVNHGLSTGTLARQIAKGAGAPRLVIEDAFLSGLLHDIGVLILANSWPERYEKAMRLARERRMNLEQAEQEVFGTTHADVGTYLLWLWGMPDSVIEAVAYHHDPSRCPVSAFSPLTAVHIANAFEGCHSEGFPEQSRHDRDSLNQENHGLDLEYLGAIPRGQNSDWRGWLEEAVRLKEAV